MILFSWHWLNKLNLFDKFPRKPSRVNAQTQFGSEILNLQEFQSLRQALTLIVNIIKIRLQKIIKFSSLNFLFEATTSIFCHKKSIHSPRPSHENHRRKKQIYFYGSWLWNYLLCAFSNSLTQNVPPIPLIFINQSWGCKRMAKIFNIFITYSACVIPLILFYVARQKLKAFSARFHSRHEIKYI